ncbi:hypothetical protein CCR75_002866 [Bremia lactucae]|uniref:RxLR effector protein n=1 Tax=Bremia lactucae TaxID=4779 RepID=A0A976FM49_BRELC|nr:hypothetical protein CCR75_002868 [Bremia lactucae]TDH69333.1 hypothetical protein CCR75_002866 [Bremia lactucae]
MHLIRSVLIVVAALVAISEGKSIRGTDYGENLQQGTDANMANTIEDRRSGGIGREPYRATGIGILTPFMYSSDTPNLDRKREHFARKVHAAYMKMQKDNQAV